MRSAWHFFCKFDILSNHNVTSRECLLAGHPEPRAHTPPPSLGSQPGRLGRTQVSPSSALRGCVKLEVTSSPQRASRTAHHSLTIDLFANSFSHTSIRKPWWSPSSESRSGHMHQQRSFTFSPKILSFVHGALPASARELACRSSSVNVGCSSSDCWDNTPIIPSSQNKRSKHFGDILPDVFSSAFGAAVSYKFPFCIFRSILYCEHFPVP